MRNTLILTLAMAGFSSAQVSSYNTVLGGIPYAAVVSLEDGKSVTYLAYTATIPTYARGSRTVPITTVYTYPPGYIEELFSLEGVYSTEPARASIASVEAKATGVEGSAVTAMSLLTAGVTGPTALADPDVAQAYLKSYNSIFTLLPTEVQAYQNSIADRFSSVYEKYDLVNWTLSNAQKDFESTNTRTGIQTMSTETASVLTSDLGHLTSSILANLNATSTATAPITVSTGGVEAVRMGVAGYLAAAGAAGLGVAAVLL